MERIERLQTHCISDKALRWLYSTLYESESVRESEDFVPDEVLVPRGYSNTHRDYPSVAFELLAISMKAPHRFIQSVITSNDRVTAQIEFNFTSAVRFLKIEKAQ
jgi:hypothetical protein